MSQVVWKYAWNPNGYGPESFSLPTYGFLIGDAIPLSHTFFKREGLSAFIEEEGLKKTLKISTTKGADIDLVLAGKDQRLSDLIGKQVFRFVILNSPRALNTNIFITCEFLGDALDPTLFNQNLNQEADVFHKSITARKGDFETATIGDLDVSTMQGGFGEINNDKARFIANSLELEYVGGRGEEPRSVIVDEKGASFPNRDVYIKTIYGELRLGLESKRWEIYHKKLKKFVPLSVLDVDDFTKEDFPGIPVILAKNPQTLTFVDWLRIDPKTETITIRNMIAERIDVAEEITIGPNIKVTKDGGLIVGRFAINMDQRLKALTIGNTIKIGEDFLQIGPLFLNNDMILGLTTLGQEVQIIKQALKRGGIL